MQRKAPRRTASFSVQQNVVKKLVTQELAAASGVPPAFHRQLPVEPRCIFFRKSASACAIVVRCGALRRVTESLGLHVLVRRCELCLVPFARYLTLNNIVTLKSGLQVTQGH